MTRLDDVARAFNDAPDDETRARALFATLAATELCLLLAEEARNETIQPKLFPLETGPVALAFDSEDRLSEFAGPAPFAALSGRALAGLLAGREIGLGLNLGTDVETMLPPLALDWLAEQRVAAHEADTRPVAFHQPTGVPEHLLPELEARVASTEGLALKAVLAKAEYADGTRRTIIGFLGAQPGAEGALSVLIGEVLAISGLDAAGYDIAFLPENSQAAARLMTVGLAIEIPKPHAPSPPDPSRPPKLR